MSKQKITILNGVEIFAQVNENGQVFVPVKPICQAIGVDHDAQSSLLYGISSVQIMLLPKML